MKKIVINTCYGGFNISEEAIKHLNYDGPISAWDIPRDDARLIATVEELGHLANGQYAELKIVEIPDDVDWQIIEDYGVEHIAEKHRTWD
jgi:hypothetical protein